MPPQGPVLTQPPAPTRQSVNESQLQIMWEAAIWSCVPGFGFRVSGFGFRVSSLGLPADNLPRIFVGTLKQTSQYLYLTESVWKVVVKKLIPARTRQLILYCYYCIKHQLTDLYRN